ncbi:MAG: hypothetical protein KDD62_15385 [Bdellovibrionales bacterium]|nr:hypothetical protein [Bdellovibrionales bacterium]
MYTVLDMMNKPCSNSATIQNRFANLATSMGFGHVKHGGRALRAKAYFFSSVILPTAEEGYLVSSHGKNGVTQKGEVVNANLATSWALSQHLCGATNEDSEPLFLSFGN